MRIRAWWLFNDLKVGQEKFFHKLFLHKGEYVYLAGSRIKNSDGVPELQILICFNRPEEAILTYKKRWEIETAFRAMKSSGFNIEDTHMRDMDRIARLVAMVCMALVWAYLVGEHKDINIKPIRILKHGRKEKSLVKYGLGRDFDHTYASDLYPKIRCFQIFVMYLSRVFIMSSSSVWMKLYTSDTGVRDMVLASSRVISLVKKGMAPYRLARRKKI